MYLQFNIEIVTRLVWQPFFWHLSSKVETFKALHWPDDRIKAARQNGQYGVHRKNADNESGSFNRGKSSQNPVSPVVMQNSDGKQLRQIRADQEKRQLNSGRSGWKRSRCQTQFDQNDQGDQRVLRVHQPTRFGNRMSVDDQSPVDGKQSPEKNANELCKNDE